MRNERGQAVVGLAVVLTILTGLFYLYASEKTSRIMKIYRSTEATRYAHEIAADLAVKLRWSYDIAQTVASSPMNANMCTNAGGNIVSVGTIQLCWPAVGDICTLHPARSDLKVCLNRNSDLYVKNSENKSDLHLIALLLKSHTAWAGPFSPPLPAPTDTNNALPAKPICLNGDCDVVCGTNADCLTFRFCPLASAHCDDTDNDWIWQTVGFFK
jgi:hypothetical protein